MKKRSDSNIFLDEKNSDKSEDKLKDTLAIQTVPYLKRGDSSVYINQFLSKEEELQPQPIVKI